MSARRYTSLAISLCLATLLGVSATLMPRLPASAALAPPANPLVVYVVNTATPEIGLSNAYGTQTATFAVAINGTVINPVLSPNGAKVAFTAADSSSSCALYTVNADGSDLTAFPNPPGGTCLGNPAWSPDSAQLAFDSNAAGSFGIWVANADGTDASEVAVAGSQPSWSPTGTRLAYVATSAQGQALETIASTGGPATVLTTMTEGPGPVGEYMGSPAWSPDGTRIAYVHEDVVAAEQQGYLNIISANGTGNEEFNRVLDDQGQASVLSWCPSGTCLIAEPEGTTDLASGSSGLKGAPVYAAANGGLLSTVAAGGYDASFIGVAGPTTAIPASPLTLGAAATPDGRGVWTAATDGGVFTYGDAQFHGSMGGKTLNAPVIGIAATSDGRGYWQVAADGGIFSFGNAQFHGSMGGQPLNKPVVGMAADPATGGYWEVASDGGVFSFDAPFLGSMGGKPLNEPIVGMAAAADGGGYWLVAFDGGIFAYGTAAFLGSMGGQSLNQPVVGMAAAPAGGGYWEVARDGGVFSFGAATFAGSPASTVLASPVVAFVSEPTSSGYGEVTAGGGLLNFGSAPT